METIVGYAFAWAIGNQDALTILCVMTFGLGLVYTTLMIWKHYEGDDDR